MTRVVHVAVGVVVDPDGNILIAKRPDTSHQGGLWEFPGGKVEPGETLFAALKRELHEELAIEITTTEPLIKIRHDYGDKQVLLDVHKVMKFNGQPKGNEGQPVRWVAPADLHLYHFPAANRPIISAIKLPRRLLITGDFQSVDECYLRVESALRRGIRLIQLRMSDPTSIPSLAGTLSSLCAKFGAQLQLNCSPELFISGNWSNTGLHLNSYEVMRCEARPVGDQIVLGASCHNEKELAQAQKIGVDYLLLSPVNCTLSHPEREALGWDKFAQLIEPVTIPVFALGGMVEADLPRSIEMGAQGIAAISEWWN